MVRIFQCEDSTDGIFSGVYDAWDSRLGHERVRLELKDGMNYELFAEYQKVEVNPEKAEKVARTLKSRLGMEDYAHIYQASLSKEKDKADRIYRTIVLGISGKRKGSIMNRLQQPDISRVFELSRATGNEAHRYIQFIRFKELKNGVLFTEIKPENQVLPLIGEHFSDRFPGEHFLIYDMTHQMFLMHEAWKTWVLVEGEEINREESRSFSEREEEIQKLWRGFFKSIAIEERKNLKLQQQFLPLKFRPYMTEI